MNSAIERLIGLRVADVMASPVVTVDHNQSLDEVADVFVRNEISGAPVVDEYQALVGLLSATDFVRHHAAQCQEDRAERAATGHPALFSHLPPALQTLRRYPEDKAGNNMSTALQTLRKEQSLLDVCREMCALHVHRLPVVDQRGRVEGMVTSLDVVAALLHAVEE